MPRYMPPATAWKKHWTPTRTSATRPTTTTSTSCPTTMQRVGLPAVTPSVQTKKVINIGLAVWAIHLEHKVHKITMYHT